VIFQKLLILKTLILSLTNWPIISYQAKRKAFSSFRTLKVSSVFGLLLSEGQNFSNSQFLY